MNEKNIDQELNFEENLNELMQIKRDKLKYLQEHGKDPFKITV